MNVVFFDVDGVLNSEKFLCDKQGEFINPKNVANLKMIVDATHAKLVMTSDWRKQVIDKDVSKAHVRELIGRLAVFAVFAAQQFDPFLQSAVISFFQRNFV